MQAGGADPVAGRLGSYDYCDTSADSQPPALASLEPVTLTRATDALTVSIADGTPFVRWRAGYTANDPDAEVSLGTGGPAEPLTTVPFAGPPSGDWLVVVRLDFGAEVGAAYYYWRVVTP